jgi:hypothetical protein
MTDAPTAAPPAPAPAPAAAAPAAAPSTPPSPSASPGLADAFSELEQLAATPAPASNTPKRDKPADAAEPVPDKPTAPPTEQKPEAAAAPTAPVTDDGTPRTAAQLRTAYDTTKKRVAQLETELQAARNGHGEHPEVAKIKEAHGALEKRYAELADEMRFLSYEKSPEYKDKWEKPLSDAFRSAYQDVSELTMLDEDGAERAATAKDFDTLMRLPLNQAATKAKEWFGEAGPEVLAHRRRIIDLNRARSEAVEKFRAEGGEREKKFHEEHQARQTRLNSIWQETNKQAAEKFPKFFAPDPADPEGNALLEKGYKLADMAFSGNNQLTPEQTVKLHAELRNRAAGFTRMAYRAKKLEARVAELETDLKAYKASEPDGGDGGAPAGGGGEADSVEAELTRLARGK